MNDNGLLFNADELVGVAIIVGSLALWVGYLIGERVTACSHDATVEAITATIALLPDRDDMPPGFVDDLVERLHAEEEQIDREWRLDPHDRDKARDKASGAAASIRGLVDPMTGRVDNSGGGAA